MAVTSNRRAFWRLKGAQVIFSPHYNYISKEYLLTHFQHVRSDHIARATENGVYFLRGNNVTFGRDAGMSYDGVGYGDSYLLDPFGEMVVRSRATRRISSCRPDLGLIEKAGDLRRTLFSAREFGRQLLEAAEQAGPPISPRRSPPCPRVAQRGCGDAAAWQKPDGSALAIS